METVKGKWVFNETLSRTGWAVVSRPSTVSTNYIRQSVNFMDGAGDSYSAIESNNTVNSTGNKTWLGFGGGWRYYWTNYEQALGWREQHYRTIDFGSTPQTVDDDFYAWFVANAVEVKEGINITYNGTETTIEAGQTATLACNGKKALTDVVVVFGADGSITYNGTETAVSAGQTATMACAGKKMLTDVVIAVKSAEDELSGTWVFNDTITIPSENKTFNLSFTNASTNDYFNPCTQIIFSSGEYMKYANHNSTGWLAYMVDKWNGDQWKTITINSTLAEVEDGDTLLAWLKANATKQ